jgi:hypothetical protein
MINEALQSIATESEVIIPRNLFDRLVRGLDEGLLVNDQSNSEQVTLTEIIESCVKNQPHYLPDLQPTAQYYDVTYRTPSGATGTHCAVQANDLIDAVMRCPIMLSFGTPWHPSEFQVLAVVPTQPENWPQPTEPDNGENTLSGPSIFD